MELKNLITTLAATRALHKESQCENMYLQKNPFGRAAAEGFSWMMSRAIAVGILPSARGGRGL